jgi:hypothetical protein
MGIDPKFDNPYSISELELSLVTSSFASICKADMLVFMCNI